LGLIHWLVELFFIVPQVWRTIARWSWLEITLDRAVQFGS
jgi:hypothetical protein